MTVSEFLNNIRDKLADTNDPLLWRDDELLTYLNDVLGYIYTEIPLLEKKYSFQTQKDTSSYALPDDFDREFSVYCENSMVYKLSMGEIENLFLQGGKPRYYCIYDNYIHLAPVPDKAYDICLYYVGRERDLTFDDEITLPRKLFPALEHGVLWRAYMKADSETFNLELAQYNYSTFISLVSFFKARHVRDKDVPRLSAIHRGLL